MGEGVLASTRDESEEVGRDLAVCPACGERNPAPARFCMHCGARMAVEGGERRQVSVLFADLAGFTSYSESVDPEAVRALADATADRLGQIVTRYGGTVDKIIGDCVMAVWGAPTAHEDDPERAVRAGLDMQAEVAADPQAFAGLKLSVGVHTGEAIWAPVGPSGTYTVLGDTVNTAARLQGAAAAGEILVGQVTARGIEAAIDLAEVEPLTVKNKAEPVPAWRAVGVRGAKASTVTRSAFQGRTMTMARLRELWEKAQTESQTYLACLLGEPGIGKSRVIEEFRSGLGADARVLAGRCLPYGEGMTYWPVYEILREAAGIAHNDDEEVTAKKLGLLLEDLGIDDVDQLRTMAVAIANLVAAPTTPRGTYSAERITRSELHWGIRRLLQLMARHHPLLLVIEGLHHAEPALLDLVASIADGQLDAPVMILSTAAPTFADEHPELLDPRSRRRRADLGPLSEGEAAALLRSIDPDGPAAGDAALLERAGGCPLFIEEGWRLIRETGSSDIPDDLGRVISARLDLVSPEARRVAAHAAVIGHIFWRAPLEAALGDDIDRALSELEERDLIRRRALSGLAGDDEFEFRHIAVLRVAQRALTRRERAGVHALLADWTALMPGADRSLIEIIAYHRERAVELSGDDDGRRSAVDALVAAAQRAENRDGAAEAARFYERALTLQDDDEPRALDLRLRRAQRLGDLGHLAEAIEEGQRVADDAIRRDEPMLGCRALVTLAMFRSGIDPSRAEADADQAGTLLDRTDDPALRIDHMLVRGSLAIRAGRAEDGMATLRTAFARAEASGDRTRTITAGQQVAWALLDAGRLGEVEALLERCADLAREDGSLRAEIDASWVLAELTYFTGPRQRSEELALRTLTWLERVPDPLIEMRMRQRLGALAMTRGEIALAERSLREAYAVARGPGGAALVDAARRLAQAYIRLQRPEDAARMVRAARRHLPAGDERAQADLELLEAFVAAANADAAAVRAGFERGIAAREHSPLDQAELRVLYARSLAHLGDQAAARAELARARATFEAMGAAAMLEDVDEAAAMVGAGA